MPVATPVTTNGAGAKPAKPSNFVAAIFSSIYWSWVMFFHSGFKFITWVRPKWYPTDMTDQRGKIVVITGGNIGLGYATAKAYYAHGATVYILCRNEQRAAKAIDDLKRGGTADILSKMVYGEVDASKAGELKYVPCDLADLVSVNAAVASLQAQVDHIDVFFANAGIMAMYGRTKQDYPIQFGTNVLGHQRLISQLLPLLQASSRATGRPARFISLSSAGHMAAPRGGVNYASLAPGAPLLEKWIEYGESKWANIALAKYVDAHYGPRAPPGAASGKGEIVAIALHPGIVSTNLFMHITSFSWLAHTITWALSMVSCTASTGALNQIWAGECPVEEARELSGGYVWCFQTRGRERDDLHDRESWDKLWDWCEKQAI